MGTKSSLRQAGLELSHLCFKSFEPFPSSAQHTGLYVEFFAGDEIHLRQRVRQPGAQIVPNIFMYVGEPTRQVVQHAAAQFFQMFRLQHAFLRHRYW